MPQYTKRLMHIGNIITLVILLFFSPLISYAQFCQNPIVPPGTYTGGLWAAPVKTMYAVNETIEFTIQSNSYGTATYTIQKDRFTTVLATGTLTLVPGVPQVVTFSLDHPGFLLFKVNQSFQGYSTGVGVDACNIQTVDSLPPDFNAFWNGLKSQLAAVPMNAQMTHRVDQSDGQQDTYKLSMDNIDGKQIHGWVSKPKCWLPQPAIIYLPSFGTQTIGPFPWIAARGAIVVSISIHDYDPELSVPGHVAYQPDCYWVDRDVNYYKWAILGIIRAIDLVYTLPEFNGTDIALSGKSQGAALAVIGAGLDSRVKVVTQSQPAMSDHAGLLDDQSSGFPYWPRNYQDCSSVTEPQLREAMGYYSVPHFARNFSGPSLSAVGYVDEICPPSTVFAVYNEFTGPKTMIHGVDRGHNGVNPEFDAAETTFLASQFNMIHVGSCPPVPLPLDLISFKGEATAEGNLLEWITENEENTAVFEIERSEDGQRFNAIVTLDAKGFSIEASYYSFLDETAPSKAYYRLRMVDLDEKFTYSDIIFLENNDIVTEDINVFPNPFEDQLSFSATKALPGVANVLLFDATGQLIASKEWEEGRQCSFSTHDLSSGVYIYRIQFDKREDIIGRIICSK